MTVAPVGTTGPQLESTGSHGLTPTKREAACLSHIEQ